MTPEQFTAWREALGGRRFFLTLGAGIVSTGLVWFEVIDQGTFLTLILGTVGAYITGATMQALKETP
jgi:uncharacterized membrane protein YeaQ/YmgE (transglycosylase-associated protein family)